jgi:hypothetical protein
MIGGEGILLHDDNRSVTCNGMPSRRLGAFLKIVRLFRSIQTDSDWLHGRFRESGA